MKKIIALLLCVLICVSFCACKERGNKGTAVMDLESYAFDGTMPKCDYVIGQSVDTLLAEFDKQSQEEGSEFTYMQREFAGNGVIDTGEYQLCYKPSDNANISCIISFMGGFGFPMGAVSIEVKEAFTKYEVQEYDTDGKELFFLLGNEFSCLKYEFETNNILFVFSKNELCATVVYDNAKWDF